MKRLVIVACASILLLAGGSGAVASKDNRPVTPVILKYGELARLGNTVEVCAASRVGTRVNLGLKQIVPLVACYPSKKGPPVIGTHINLAMWVYGPTSEVALVTAIGRWTRLKGIKDPYLSITDLWLTEDWGVSKVQFDAIVLSKDQLLGKVKVRLKPPADFMPQGVIGDIESPICGFFGVGASCQYQQPAGAKKLLNIIFWPPWGPRQTQVIMSWLNLDCTYTNDDGSQAPGCPTARPLYPRP